MAFVVVKSTFAKSSCIGNLLGKRAGGLVAANCRGVVAPIQVATLQTTHGEKYPYSKPWPYKTKQFTLLHEILMYDRSLARMNENSKVIVVDGNIGVGKTDFGRRLAKEFDLKFFPDVANEDLYITNGYDLRGCDPRLPEGAQIYDLPRFLAEPQPTRGIAGRLQLEWYRKRFFQYVEGLKHVLNTGQGVVLVRSPHSDIAFPEAMRQMGWITPKFLKYYRYFSDNTRCELLNPHLTIYLDAPLPVLRERIKARNNADEIKSKNLPDAYLQAISDAYRDKVLPMLRRNGEVLEVDWSDAGDENDMDAISEEIQTMNFECMDNEDTMFRDWYRLTDDNVANYRKEYGDDNRLFNLFSLKPPWECPEVIPSDEDRQAMNQVYKTHPAIRFRPGWAPPFGESTAMKFGN